MNKPKYKAGDILAHKTEANEMVEVRIEQVIENFYYVSWLDDHEKPQLYIEAQLIEEFYEIKTN